ncbi:AAA family ATPase [Glaesserella parasuis]|uniref:AAA family ATPase n=1 Tax=Glaesserella parasuis TaxID=738 RepID=A0AAX1M626_GLAPU|nr:AAA family ATPase [Glaesserella parasuis]MCT8544746.1 AAA family ATPase [Glaesserella parasuis]MCT8565329.1 AAA family ATPase [Glaesserella parasuis]MCT8571130.1 AAA family ATPase [Glaesserella parasuis]MCT8685076.1 AAA family ATPase [Glaesserella parasuis]MCT8752484.1 AAA family ATPase [Glaesserella parasuis]
MLKLKQVLIDKGVSLRQLAQMMKVSPATVSQLVNHNQRVKQWADFEENLSKALQCVGIFEPLATLLEVETTGDSLATEPVVSVPKTTDEIKDEIMLLAKQALFPATKKHFGLFRDPFAEDIRSAEDVFTSADVRYVREALFQTAKHGGFMAVVGESGAGKSTLRRDLIDRINQENAPIQVIEPYIIAMEDNDVKGKTLKAAHIAEAIITTLAPLENVKRSPEARFRQLHRVLKESVKSGYSNVLIIEEAHALPIPTLKHLKRFFELEDGFKKLLSIVLVGQPELKLKLSERNTEVREVVQRCEIVELAPLDAELERFVEHKLERVGKQVSDIFEEDAFLAVRQRLVAVNRQKQSTSLLYPLAVGNLLTAAMNLAESLGIPKVNGQVVMNV